MKRIHVLLPKLSPPLLLTTATTTASAIATATATSATTTTLNGRAAGIRTKT